MDLKNDIKSYIVNLLVEGVETRNMRLAKHYLYDRFGYDEVTAMKIIGGIKTDIPNSRLGKCKFMLAMVRMYSDGEFNDVGVIMNVNTCLKYAASSAHIGEYDNDLNGLSCSEFIGRFSGIVSSDLQNDKDEIGSMVYSRNSVYDIIKINSFEESEEYGNYVDWCVTYDRNMYNSYTNGGNGVFYFCLRDCYEDEERTPGDNCPLDSYGLSMIAVSVNSDGSCNTITCRWNHANGGNDSIMSTKELSKLLGVNFYDVFKPLTPDEIERNKREMLYEIEEELSSYMGYESPDEMGCDKKEYDPEYGDSVEQNVYVFFSESADGCVLIDYNWNLLYDEIFDRIGDREGDILTVNRGNYMNFLSIDGKLLSDKWFDQVINDFRYGVGLCRKGKLWNAINKEGQYIFKEYYPVIDLHGRYNRNSYFQLMNDEKLFMFSDLDGNFLLDRWFERIFKINDINSLIKFEGDNFYTLIDTITYKVKASYKVSKLLGHVSIGSRYYYRVLLDNGRDCLMTDNGSLFDYNTKKTVYIVK